MLKSVKDVIFEERPVPKIQNPTDVLIRVNVTGICGSDVNFSYYHDLLLFSPKE